MAEQSTTSAVPEVGVPLSDAEFFTLRTIAYERFGIHLTEEKRSMISVRLQKMLRKTGVATLSEYFHLLAQGKVSALVELLNQITTNHTFFYRESDHFDFMHKHVLPELSARLRAERTNDIRIWSAGCSSGEEPYMLVMLMMEFFGAQYTLWDAGVLATDISERSLETARIGLYSEERMAFIPEAYKQKYFRRMTNVHASLYTPLAGSSVEWEVIPAVREQVLFKHFNLMNEHFPFKKPFHVIFCRNVMIYFDVPTRETLVHKLYRALAPGGYLFIGHSETLGRTQQLFEYVMPAVYRKNA